MVGVGRGPLGVRQVTGQDEGLLVDRRVVMAVWEFDAEISGRYPDEHDEWVAGSVTIEHLHLRGGEARGTRTSPWPACPSMSTP